MGGVPVSNGFEVAADDPRRADVVALLRRHLADAFLHSPPEDVHALDLDALSGPAIRFVSAREPDGALLGIGALKRLDARHAELKSMRTVDAAQRRGVARAILDHLVEQARAAGVERVSLETGSMAAYAPARALYASAGFVACPPFADYVASPNSAFMTLALAPSVAR